MRAAALAQVVTLSLGYALRVYKHAKWGPCTTHTGLAAACMECQDTTLASSSAAWTSIWYDRRYDIETKVPLALLAYMGVQTHYGDNKGHRPAIR